MSNAIIERTLALAQEMKLAMGGRTSDPVNPNFLTAAAAIALHEDIRGVAPQGATGVVNVYNAESLAKQAEESYRGGYADAFRWVLSNIDLDTLDRDRLEKALDSGPEEGVYLPGQPGSDS